MTNSGTQRAELHKTIWSIANVLRGSVDGWDFKQYVLGFLFYRFISEDITSYLNEYEHQTGDVDFDYAKLNDATAEQVRKSMVEEKGYFILPSDLFANVRRCADADENLNETLQRVFKNIESSAIGSRSESSLRGLFDDLDLNSRKLGDTVVDRNAKLVKVLNAIGDLDLGTESFADNKIDAFGDAYEYLMIMYAANAGKSGGEFFTPQEVSELLTRIATHGKSEVNKVYDPACGSGSLLLQSIKVLGKDKVRQGFFGQEKNLTTYNLCRINMFLHDVNYDHFNIAYGDTLINPQHWDDEPFEVIVSNPPYSTKWEGRRQPHAHQRPAIRPGRRACAEVEGRSGVHHAHALLAGDRRHRGHRRVSRCALPRRQGTENPQIPAGEKLHRRSDSTAAEPVLRHFHRHLHHRAQEIEERRQRAVHRRVGTVCTRRQPKPAFARRHRRHHGRLCETRTG